MNILQLFITFSVSILISFNAMAEESELSWVFEHSAATAEMNSDTTLVMPATEKIKAYTDKPDRLHAQMDSRQFISLWNEGGVLSAKSEPPKAILAWDNGNNWDDIVVFITNAEIVGDGSSISYEVKIETDEIPPDKMVNTYLYVWPAKCLHCVFICGDFIFDWYCDK